MLELNEIYNCDCLEGLKKLDDNSIDLTVTSPPYDNLRSYHDTCEWSFEVFKPIAEELYRVTKKGGVVVWVVGDACINNGETGSSFQQALYFMNLGFKLHDTMIYEKNSSSFPARLTSQRYSQIFEYMFVFSKGKIRNDIKLIADKRNKWAGWTNWGQHSQYDATGNLVKTKNIKPIAEFSLRTNIWKYSVSFNDKTGHPAVFPEKLAEDHILSWSLPGETVLDPFMGSGTTAKMAMMNDRNYIGFEKNEDYYKASLQRVGKYVGAINPNISGTTIDDVEFIVNTEDDKEEAGKTELFNKLVDELNVYFNEQSLGILKNLRLTFQSKSNDERVKSVLGENNEPKPEVLPTKVETAKEPTLFDNLDNSQIETVEIDTTVKSDPEKEVATISDVRRIINEEFEKRFPDADKIHNMVSMNTPLGGPGSQIVRCEHVDIMSELAKMIQDDAVTEPVRKKRGRPKGSKNKPKINIEG